MSAVAGSCLVLAGCPFLPGTPGGEPTTTTTAPTSTTVPDTTKPSIGSFEGAWTACGGPSAESTVLFVVEASDDVEVASVFVLIGIEPIELTKKGDAWIGTSVRPTGNQIVATVKATDTSGNFEQTFGNVVDPCVPS